MMHLDPTNAQDLQRLINAPDIMWSEAMPAEYKKMALDALIAGTATMPDDTPQEIKDAVERGKEQ